MMPANPPHAPDPPQMQGLRRQLVEGLRQRGIRNAQVLEAIGRVKRHLFLDEALWPQAYKDIALPIAENQTISQPYTVAYMTELLQAGSGARVLEIGTGSGYQAAVLLEMGMQVFSVERIRELHAKAKDLLRLLGYRPWLKVGDGTRGWPTHAPYDGIIVTAASPGIPKALCEQLAIGGRLVVPAGSRESQTMQVVTRVDAENYNHRSLDDFKFVPLIGEEGWKQ